MNIGMNKLLHQLVKPYIWYKVQLLWLGIWHKEISFSAIDSLIQTDYQNVKDNFFIILKKPFHQIRQNWAAQEKHDFWICTTVQAAHGILCPASPPLGKPVKLNMR
jgi:hypothetical protein